MTIDIMDFGTDKKTGERKREREGGRERKEEKKMRVKLYRLESARRRKTG